METDILPDGTPAGDVTPSPAKSSTGLEFTPRMEAIARGEDPDAINEPPVVEEETASDGAPATETETTEAPAETESAPAETATSSEPKPWYNDQHRRQAKLYGLEDYDLDGFSSARDFLSALRFMDRQAASAAKQQPAADKAAPAAETESEEVDDDSPTLKDGRINPAYFEKHYDETAAKAFKSIQEQNDRLAAKLAQIDAERYEQEATRYSIEMHDEIDKLNRPELYGPAGKSDISDAEFNRRAQISDEVAILAQAYASTGRPMPSMGDLIRRAENNLFPAEVAAAAAKQQGAARQKQLEAIARQSKTRRPVASGTSAAGSRAAAPPDDPHSTASIMSHPNVTALFRKFEEDSGFQR